MPPNQETSDAQFSNTGPRVINLTAPEADDVFSALSGELAREILDRLYDEPMTKSELAEDLETSIQHVDYHVNKLEGADLIEIVDTVRSEKQREMKIYGPVDTSLAIIGTKSPLSFVKERFSIILGVLMLLGVSATAMFFLLSRWVEEEIRPVETTDYHPISGDPVETVILQVEQTILHDPVVSFLIGGSVVIVGVLVMDYIHRVRL